LSFLERASRKLMTRIDRDKAKARNAKHGLSSPHFRVLSGASVISALWSIVPTSPTIVSLFSGRHDMT
jgi:hypothetical protein